MRHPVYDTDSHFSLDTDTRALISNMRKVSLIRGDHNSERFTFDLPAEIEGHKLVDCDKIEVHFINIDMVTQAQSKGYYTVDKKNDLMVHPDDSTKVVFSWLIDGRATEYVGSLSFVIRVTCLDGANVIYAWHTAVYSGITISDGICVTDDFDKKYEDIVEKWRLEIEAGLHALENNLITNMRQTKIGPSDGGENEWEVTLGDGRKLTLRIKNGSRGPQGPAGRVGSVETIDGKELKFFYGRKAEYDGLNLTSSQRVNLLAVITDDPGYSNIGDAVDYFAGLKNGATKVKAAETADALSTTLYMNHVTAIGKHNLNDKDDSAVFYFSYVGAKKFNGTSTTASSISNDMSYPVPASGFIETQAATYRVIAAKPTDSGGSLTLQVENTAHVHSSFKMSSNYITYNVYSKKLTGG